jgi:hypothetical protein
MMRRASLALLLALAACSRDLPPPPTADEPKPEPPPLCGKVFKDPKVRGGAGCCLEPSKGLLTAADITEACGLPPASFLGETRDGTACRLHFQTAGDPASSYVMVSRPIVPAGAPAPVAPDPMLAWSWKKLPLRDAIGYRAVAAASEPGLLATKHALWAGRGRRIVGLHVAKSVCPEGPAETLLQKAIDRVP